MNNNRDLLPFGPLDPRPSYDDAPDDAPDDAGDSWPVEEIDDECWDALIPDDDSEPLPEYGDFWSERDAA